VIQSQDETGNIVSIVPTPDDTTLLAIDNGGASLEVINTTSLTTTKSVSLGTRPGQIQLAPGGKRAYVLDSSEQKMYVIDVATASVILTLEVAPNAESIAVPVPLLS
jgi:YVTN family beta-propeller protein